MAEGNCDTSCDYTDSNIRCLKCVSVVISVFPTIMHRLMEHSGITPESLDKRIQMDRNFRKKITKEDHQVLQTLCSDGYKKLDMTLIFKIITHYKNMFVDSPTRGWSSVPVSTDVDIGDDAQRLRLIRNHFLHKVEVELSEQEFDNFFTDTSIICDRIDKHLNCTESFKVYIEEMKTKPLIETKELHKLYEDERALKEFFLIQIGPTEFKVFVARSLSSFLQQFKENEQDEDEFVPFNLTFPEISYADHIRVMKDLHKELNKDQVNIKIIKFKDGSLVLDLRIRAAILLDDEIFRNEIKHLLMRLYEPIRTVLDAEVDVVLSKSLAVFTDDDQNDEMEEDNRMYPEGCLQLSLKAKKNIFQSEESLKSELTTVFERMVSKGNGHEIFSRNKPVVSIMELGTEAVFTDDDQKDKMEEDTIMYPEGCLQLSLKAKKNKFQSEESLKSELTTVFERVVSKGNGHEILPRNKPVVSIMEPGTDDDHKKIADIQRSISSGAERKQLAKDVIGTECSWENYIMPIPKSVAILGNLMALGTTKDFSLEEERPECGFQHIKHPSSFRACLVQLALEGSDAFSLSHRNMDKIMLYAQQFQLVIKDLVPLLLNKDETNPDLINIYLSNLNTYTKKCVELAKTTCTTFSSTINLLSEIQETSTTAKGLHENKLTELSRQQEINTKRRERNQKLQEAMHDEKRELEKQISKAKENLDKKEGEIPGVVASLAINTWNSLLSTASTVAKITALSSLSTPVGIAVGAVYAGVQTAKYFEGRETTSEHREDKSEALGLAIQIHATSQHFSKTLKTIKDSMHSCMEADEQVDQNVKHAWKEEVSDVSAQYKNILKHLQRLSCNHNFTRRAIDICECGAKLCKDIQDSRGKISDEMNDYLDEIKENAEYLKLAFEGSSMSNQMSPPGNGTVKEASEGVYKKVQMAKEELDYLRNLQLIKLKKAEKIEREQQILLEKLVEINFDTIDFNEIVKLLQECLEAFSQIQEQWRNLELFFSFMSNSIEVCLHECSNHFSIRVQYGGKIQTLDSYQVILELAASANAVAHSVGIIAKIYTDMTGKYIVGPMAGLTEILGLDPIKDKTILRKKRKQLLQRSKMASKEITKLAEESRSKQLKEIDDQFERIDALGEQLPGIPNERKTAIRDKIKDISNESKSDLGANDFI